MRNHKFLLAPVAILGALSVLVSGCASVDGETSRVNSAADFSGNYGINSNSFSSLTNENNENSDNPKFPDKCKLYKAAAVQFTEEQLFELFNAHPECGTPQKSQYYSDDYLRYETDNCVGYVTNGYNFYFCTDTGNFYDSVHYSLTELGNKNADGSTDFAAREEVLKTVQDEFSTRFGIMPDEWYAYEFDAVKKEDVEQYKQEAYRAAYEPENSDEDDDRKKEKSWYEMIKDLPADDFYYFNIKYKADSLPIFSGSSLEIGGFRSGKQVLGTLSDIIIGRNGIEYIGISPAYKVDYSDYTEVELIPAEQARELIQKKYDEIITESEIEVLGMNLSYLPIAQNNLGTYGTKFELRPHYGFYTTETETYEGKTYTIETVTYFDAVTGVELASTQIPEGEGREWGFDI